MPGKPELHQSTSRHILTKLLEFKDKPEISTEHEQKQKI